MLPPNLTMTELPTYLRSLNTLTTQRVRFTLMDLSHNVLRDIHPLALDGQVDFNDDDAADVVRTLQAGFFDPDHALELDTDAPTDGVAGMNRLVRVTVSHWVEPLDRWVSVSVFTGRPSVIGRDGEKVVLRAQDKACLHLRTAPADTIKKGTPVVKAIRDGLYAAGERFFRFPSTGSVKDRVTHDTAVGGRADEHQPWKVWRRLAHDAGLQLFYDGAGYAVLRPYPAGAPLATWSASSLTSNVQTETDLTAIRNRVIAHGHKKSVHTETAPASHPLSPRNLAVNGEPWVNAYHVDAPHLRGAALARHARRILVQQLTQGVSVKASVVPLFHLDPLDHCRIVKVEGAVSFNLHDASVALGPDGDMSIGAQRRVRRASAGRIGVAA